MAQISVRQFAGDIRFWEIQNDGTHVAVIPEGTDLSGNQPLEVDTLTFGYEAGDEQKVVSKRRDARYQQPIHSETLPGSTQVTVTALEVPPIMLARMLYGSAAVSTVADGSTTDDVYDVPADPTQAIQLDHRFIKASPPPVVKKNGGDSLVVDTDYKIDARRGLLYLISPTAKGEEKVKVSYSHPAQLQTTIKGGAVPTRAFKIVGDMQDRISGKSGELTIPRANLTTDGDVDWLSDEPIKVTLTGDCLIAPPADAAYTFVEYEDTTT